MKGTPLTPAEAQARVDAYRGSKSASSASVVFTREVVRDALRAAPQPVTSAWISYSTSVVGLLARASEASGLVLDRSLVLDRARIDRFLSHECGHLTPQARSGYRSRLDVIAHALLNGQNDGAWPRAAMSARDVMTPWDDRQAARVALWTSGLRPAGRRDRMRGALALALGAGLRRRDLLVVTGTCVTRTVDGVTVTVPPSGGEPSRGVTVLAGWEAEVRTAAKRAGNNLIVAPDRQTLTSGALTASIDTANRSAPAGDEFSLRRARNTWLARHLAAGTPLTVLMPEAGLRTTQHLQDLLPYVSRPDAAAAAAFMRGI